jgi:hypothetical protein
MLANNKEITVSSLAIQEQWTPGGWVVKKLTTKFKDNKLLIARPNDQFSERFVSCVLDERGSKFRTLQLCS